jgi:hypothetical protein
MEASEALQLEEVVREVGWHGINHAQNLLDIVFCLTCVRAQRHARSSVCCVVLLKANKQG